ncbi:MAG: 50S ribosomal protein L10 [Candidatus Omnitrophica bacterium]|nr:50S ribosomal protein L10 [Candidatus Omnitrophota bacterium]
MNRESYGRLAKVLLNEEMKKDLSSANQIFVTEYSKMSTNALEGLRRKLRGEKTRYRVVKTSIARRMVPETPFGAIKDEVRGQCALALSAGEVTAVSKIIVEFADENETFKVRTMMMDDTVYSWSKIKELSKLPGRQELLARVCGQLNAPITGLVGALSGVLRNFVSVLDQIKSQKEKPTS